MGELRDRMVRDMDVRRFSQRTIESYVAGVRGLAKYYHRPPDQLSNDEVQRYLLYIREQRQLSASTCNQVRCALKFFYEVTVRRPQTSLAVPPMRREQKLPEILSREEVERIIAAARTLRERLLLMAAYGSGLRVSEVVALRPADLDVERGVIRVNRRLLYGLLFRIAARTLRTFARDPRHLGAEPAITIVLHTWGQTLDEHYHVHCVVSGGGLSLDGRSWVALPGGKTKRRRPFLFDVAALSRVFRGKFSAALERARRRGTLRYIGQSAALAQPGHSEELMTALWKPDWVVYAKAPFGGPAHVLKYLSRYTHRVAISNQRLLSVAAGIVRFEYHDYAAAQARKELSLPATEFLRRFLLHVVPTGFMRVRHYGLSANRHRDRKLQRCCELLGGAPPATTDIAPATQAAPASTVPASSDAPSSLCPHCGTPLWIIEILPATRADPLLSAVAAHDTS